MGTNIDYLGPARQSTWRRIAIGTWRTAADPSTYGLLELRADAALAYIDRLSKQTNEHITLTHFMVKAIAVTLRRHPELNSVLRFGKIYQRKAVSIFLQVARDAAGHDLSGTLVRDADQKSILEIAREMQANVHAIREVGDAKVYKIKHHLLAFLPAWAIAWVLRFGAFVTYRLNVWFPFMGLPRDAFGSAMLTNIGSLGLGIAFAPLVPYSQCPAVLALSAVEERPVVDNGQLGVGKIVWLCATIDHRVIDGIHAAKMAKTLKALLANPEGEL